eukprot:6190892-Pleurochrysis_carterae.AAC.1
MDLPTSMGVLEPNRVATIKTDYSVHLAKRKRRLSAPGAGTAKPDLRVRRTDSQPFATRAHWFTVAP